MHTVGTAILADTVGQEGVGPAMGFIGMSIALGVLIGPVVGGFLYHTYGYLAVFISAYAVRTSGQSLEATPFPFSPDAPFYRLETKILKSIPNSS